MDDTISRADAIDAEDSKMIRLLHGDCLELMKDIPDKSIDMILCDLPYGLTHCDWDIPIDMESLWNQYKRIIKDHGAILLFSIQPFTSDLIQSNRKMFRYEIVWQKTLPLGYLNANRMPLRGHENIVVFYKHLPTYNPQKRKVQVKKLGYKRVRGTEAKQYNNHNKWEWTETGERMPTDVITFANGNGAQAESSKGIKHPTQKPIPLLEYLIKTYTNEGDTVLDNCMGSGSTGVACVNLNRNFIGMELKREYFDISRERIDNARFNQQTGGD